LQLWCDRLGAFRRLFVARLHSDGFADIDVDVNHTVVSPSVSAKSTYH
jgi:hypothetical protein